MTKPTRVTDDDWSDMLTALEESYFDAIRMLSRVKTTTAEEASDHAAACYALAMDLSGRHGAVLDRLIAQARRLT